MALVLEYSGWAGYKKFYYLKLELWFPTPAKVTIFLFGYWTKV